MYSASRDSTDQQNSMIDNSFAIVTPSFRPDLARCELLSESVDRFSTDINHYILIDRRDFKYFRHLESTKRKLVLSEDLIGKWLMRLPGRNGWWIGWRSQPVRGWILQQLLKISATSVAPEDTLVFCDSDTVFIRPFSGRDFLIGDKVGLLDVPFANDDIIRWSKISRQVLGIADRQNQAPRGHVGNMICWSRPIAAAMQDHIANVHGIPWQVALARRTSFSEYMLYGTFVREILGYGATNHTPSQVPLVKANWGGPIHNDASANAFVNEVAPESIALMIHSKDNSDMDSVIRAVRQSWSRNSS